MAPSSSSSSLRDKALADALAGVAATLVSLWTFYPIDVWKTKLQAATKHRNDDEDDLRRKISNSPIKQQPLLELFRGIHWKTLHAASSSFCYFFWYSWIVSWWQQQQQRRQQPTKLSPAVRLTLSAVAAMLNTLLTLPLDVLASRHQAQSDDHNDDNDDDSIEESYQGEESSSVLEEESPLSTTDQRLSDATLMDHVWKQVVVERSDTSPTETSDSSESQYDDDDNNVKPSTEDMFHDSVSNHDEGSSCSEEEKKSEEETMLFPPPRHSLRVTIRSSIRASATTTTLSSNTTPKKLRFETPHCSSQTTANAPSRVNKTTALSKQKSDNHPTTNKSKSSSPTSSSLWKGLVPSLLLCTNPSIHYTVFDMAKTRLLQQRSHQNLSMLESFLLGLMAKFCATMATYPLIRAKVMLMVTSQKGGMIRTLVEIYQRHGILHGLYKGCSVQLFHTVLKTALLMMAKERIAQTTHRLLSVNQNNNHNPSSTKT